MRYVFLVLAIIISLHYILSFTHEGYGRATSLSNIKDRITSPKVPPYKVPLADDYYIKKNTTSPQGRRANATIVMLGMSSTLVSLRSTPLRLLLSSTQW